MTCFLFFLCLSSINKNYSPELGTDDQFITTEYTQSKVSKRSELWASHFKLSPDLVKGVIEQESRWNHRATSAVGAKGLMQLMDATAEWLGKSPEESLYNPDTNIYYGCKYLRYLLDKFSGSSSDALMAYYAGPRVIESPKVTYVHKLKSESAAYSFSVLGKSISYMGVGIGKTFL